MRVRFVSGILLHALCVGLMHSSATLASAADAILVVPSTSAAGVYSSVLEAGKTYTLWVSGTYQYGTSAELIADAEWAYADGIVSGKRGWYDVATFLQPPEAALGLDLLVDGRNRDWVGCSNGTNWSARVFSPNHVYKLELVGQGVPVHFSIYDTDYSDNSGDLMVQITPEPGTLGLLLLSLGAAVGLRRPTRLG